MTGAPTWVVGAGGLLGSHVAESLRRQGGPVLTRRVPWSDPQAAQAALRDGVDALAAVAAGGPWNLAWCAGTGVVSTPEAELRSEVDRFTGLLDALAAAPLNGRAGAVFLASSAGGVYAGSPVRAPFTERSPVGALVAYGRAKLAMEAAVDSFAGQTGASVLVGRIANIYGPGQDLTKPQGLISQLCRTHVTGFSLTVYVPLDTMRDYVFAADCGDLVAAALAGLRRRTEADSGSRVVTKIIASGQCTTIGSLLAESARLYKRRPRVVVRAPVEGTGQVTDLRLRSIVWTELDAHLRTVLTVGMARTAADVGQQTRRLGTSSSGGWRR